MILASRYLLDEEGWWTKLTMHLVLRFERNDDFCIFDTRTLKMKWFKQDTHIIKVFPPLTRIRTVYSVLNRDSYPRAFSLDARPAPSLDGTFVVKNPPISHLGSICGVK